VDGNVNRLFKSLVVLTISLVALEAAHPISAQEFIVRTGRPLPIGRDREASVIAVSAVLTSGTKVRILRSQLCQRQLLDERCPPERAYRPRLSDPLPVMPLHDLTTYRRVTRLFGTTSKEASVLRFQRPVLRGDTIVVTVAILAKLEVPNEFDETTYEVLIANTDPLRVLSKVVTTSSYVRSAPPDERATMQLRR